MALILFNGQRSPVGGWFQDGHGHRLFVKEGDFLPICPRGGPSMVRWLLIQEIPSTP